MAPVLTIRVLRVIRGFLLTLNFVPQISQISQILSLRTTAYNTFILSACGHNLCNLCHLWDNTEQEYSYQLDDERDTMGSGAI